VSANDERVRRGGGPELYSKLAGRTRIVRPFVASEDLTDTLARSCALIEAHRPDLIDYSSLDKSPEAAAKNTELAFKIAEETLGIAVRPSFLRRIPY
jgi:hypothetical protein